MSRQISRWTTFNRLRWRHQLSRTKHMFKSHQLLPFRQIKAKRPSVEAWLNVLSAVAWRTTKKRKWQLERWSSNEWINRRRRNILHHSGRKLESSPTRYGSSQDLKRCPIQTIRQTEWTTKTKKMVMEMKSRLPGISSIPKVLSAKCGTLLLHLVWFTTW